MARSDELEAVLQFAGKFGAAGEPEAKGELGFHQGVMESWDAVTRRNSVRLLGTVVHDLPMLTMSDSVLLAEGDTVAVLRFRSSYFILGRIIPPASLPRPVFVYDVAERSGFDVPGSGEVVASLEFVPPNWASEATVIASCAGQVNNTSGSLSNVNCAIGIDRIGSGSTYTAVEADHWQGIPIAFSRNITVTPGVSFLVELGLGVSAQTWPFHADNALQLSATVIYGNS